MGWIELKAEDRSAYHALSAQLAAARTREFLKEKVKC